MIYQNESFNSARPIFPRGRCEEQNLTVMFRTELEADRDTVMKMTGNCSYRVFINGKFVIYGPARAGRDHFRVDELEIGKYLTDQKNDICVLLSSYNCYSFHHMKGAGFFICEFICNDSILAPTGSDAWKAYIYDERYIKTVRQSFQREFSEAYDMTAHIGGELSVLGRQEVECEILPDKIYIKRELSLPEFPREELVRFVESGNVTRESLPQDKYFKGNIYTKSGSPGYDGYPFSEFEIIPLYIAQELTLDPCGAVPDTFPFTLGVDRYLMGGLRQELTGFITLEVECKEDCELILTYDELLSDGKVNFMRMGCCNVLYFKLKGNESYKLMTAEPYSLQYLNIIALGGEVTIKGCGILNCGFNKSEINKKLNPTAADGEIERIFNAAVETFCQNTFDIYMDCPSRERAGWLCDSFFTSRVEKLLTGKSTVEKCFLANFMMDKEPQFLPKGMLPMCYPSDHSGGNFIPNWAMWYVIELEEYLRRTGDRAFIDDIKDRLYDLLAYFRRFENSDGLLERLERWVFVEWSKSNELTQHINYPTNMLYCMFKHTLGKLYGDTGLEEESAQLKKVIREQSLGELFFCDNAVYDSNGVAHLSGEITETCQYYAFFCGVATPSENPTLWKTMLDDFGPQRKESNKWETVYFSNAFIGNYLRCDILMREGEREKLDQNIRGYFDYMAQITGTLWENDTAKHSCNHGFASHVLVWLDYLGYLE